MHAFPILVAAITAVSLAFASPVAVLSSGSSDAVAAHPLRRDPQVDTGVFPGDFNCATTWPDKGGEGPPFLWKASFTAGVSRDGFTHAHVFLKCGCNFWDNDKSAGKPLWATSTVKDHDWWGDLPFRAFSIQCFPLDLKAQLQHSQQLNNTKKHNVTSDDMLETRSSTNGPNFCGTVYELTGSNGRYQEIFANDDAAWISYYPLQSAVIAEGYMAIVHENEDGSGDSWVTPSKNFTGDLPFSARRVQCLKDGSKLRRDSE